MTSIADSPLGGGSPSHGLRAAIRRLSPRAMTVIFGTGYVVIALMVLFPPAYLAASGSQPLVFGMPLSIFYMFLNAVLLILLVTGLWLIEGVRDEREIHMTEDADLHPSGE